jgi:hypothetical protein
MNAGAHRHRRRLGAHSKHPPTSPATALSVWLKKSAALSRTRNTAARTPCEASPASVGCLISASITVESIRTARGRNRFSRVALTINARVSSDTVSAAIRLVSLRTVDSSGTRSERLIRQNRRRWIESDTSATKVRYPQRYRALSTINRTYVSNAIVGRPSVSTARPVCSNSWRHRSTNGHSNS